MKEGFDSYATPTPIPEQGLSGNELITSALQHALEDNAAADYASVLAALDQDSFAAAISAFNARTPEERGKDKYNHERPLTENVAHAREQQTVSGYPLTITLERNGEISLSTSLVN